MSFISFDIFIFIWIKRVLIELLIILFAKNVIRTRGIESKISSHTSEERLKMSKMIGSKSMFTIISFTSPRVTSLWFRSWVILLFTFFLPGITTVDFRKKCMSSVFSFRILYVIKQILEIVMQSFCFASWRSSLVL